MEKSPFQNEFDCGILFFTLGSTRLTNAQKRGKYKQGLYFPLKTKSYIIIMVPKQWWFSYSDTNLIRMCSGPWHAKNKIITICLCHLINAIMCPSHPCDWKCDLSYYTINLYKAIGGDRSEWCYCILYSIAHGLDQTEKSRVRHAARDPSNLSTLHLALRHTVTWSSSELNQHFS